MPKSKTKLQLIESIHVERRRLENTLALLSKRDMQRRGVVGNWSVKDLLAHLVAWEQLFLTWYRSGVRNLPSKTTPVGMNRKAIARLNERIFLENQHRPLRAVLRDFEGSYKKISKLIETIPEDDMFSHNRYAWTGKLTLADYIVGNTSNHYRWAKSQIQQWRKRLPSHSSRPHLHPYVKHNPHPSRPHSLPV